MGEVAGCSGRPVRPGTLARAALGRGGALIAAAGFITVRGGLAILVGPVLNHTVPRFPLYLGIAVAVELGAAWKPGLRPLPRALLIGGWVGTVGLATEWVWMQAWGRHPWGTSLLPGVLVAAAAAVPAAVIGLSMGRVLSFRSGGIKRTFLAIAGAALVVGLALPLPRHDAPYKAIVSAEPVARDRVAVAVSIHPHLSVDDLDWFEVLAWQGGAMVTAPLIQEAPDRYRTDGTVPVEGDWKTLVRLARKDVMVAVPIYMPADPEIGASEIPVQPVREANFARDTKLLMREAHEGEAWPALLAYGSILFVALSWLGLFIISLSKVGP